nr:unnamed protein product [Callosobruchus chinensis]
MTCTSLQSCTFLKKLNTLLRDAVSAGTRLNVTLRFSAYTDNSHSTK